MPKRPTPEQRRAYQNRRYAEDPEYRARIQAQRKAYYAANREKVKARMAAWRRDNPRRYFAQNVLRRYGITLEQWDALLIEQCGRCMICRDPMENPQVDHCHNSLVVRGLLCSACNTGIGLFREDPQRLEGAMLYLSRVP